MTSRRWIVAVALAAVSVAGWAAPAMAHANLTTTNPSASEVLSSSPTEVVLRFSEPVDPASDPIRILTSTGAEVAVTPVQRREAGLIMAVAPMQPLVDGSYVVAWAAVSEDSHPISGAFAFAVGASSGVPDDALIAASGSDAGSAGEQVVFLGRFGSFTGVIGVIGVFLVLAICAPGLVVSKRARLVGSVFAGVGVAGTVAMIVGQAMAIGGSATAWRAVADTSSGRWWIARLTLLLAAGTGVVMVRTIASNRHLQIIAALGAAGLLAVVVAGGHSATGRWQFAAFVSTWTHLAAASVWAGGLVGLTLVVPRDQLWATAQRFSRLALGSVAVLVASGTLSAWRQMGTWRGFTDSSYGRWLLAKIVLIGVVLVAAALTRSLLRTAPEVAGRHHDEPVDAVDEADRSRRVASATTDLRWGVGIEATGILLVLAMTAGLTGSPPPVSSVSFAESVTVAATVADRIATIDLVPARTGGTTMHVTISSPAGALDVADEVTVSASLAERQLGPIEIAMVPAGPNHVTTNDANFPVPGRWTIAITARYGDFDQVVFTIETEIG